MKPFDIELAKAGHPVCTRDGKPARIICFDCKGPRDTVMIVALIMESHGENAFRYKGNGRFSADNVNHNNDLMMVPEKREGWINIYRDELGFLVCGNRVFSSMEEAKKNCIIPEMLHVDTIPIKWEE